MKRITLIIIYAFITCCWLAEARTPSDSVSVRFRQSVSAIDPALDDNGRQLSEMVRRLLSGQGNDSCGHLKGVRVIGGASPEGSVGINRRLSEQRAANLFGYFSERAGLPDSLASFSYIGRDWKGLYTEVLNDSAVPYRQEVIGLLDDVIGSMDESTTPDERNAVSDNGYIRLRKLHDGEPYRYMYAMLFPSLRESRLYVDYYRCPQRIAVGPANGLFTDAPAVPPTDMSPLLPEFGQEDGCLCRPFYMSVKTNLLYDALVIPNIGVEFYLGKNWSIAANWMYAWWDTDRTHHYWRNYGGDITLRKWFGHKAAEKPLTGHHVGIYAGVITYDFEFGGTGYMGGLPGRTLWSRCNFMGGVEYGYSLPVARRLNLDFTIGIGYLGGEYMKYIPEDGHYVWQSTHKLKWFGPTKAEISLVWLIGCDNFNRKKGGRS